MDWSPADAKQAAADGWRMDPMLGPIRSYDRNGQSRISSQYKLYNFIRTMSASSEFYRRVYDEIVWNATDDYAARDLGWGISTGELGTRDLTKFLTNEEAKDHVANLAEQNDPLAVKALTTLARRRLTTMF